MEAVEVLVLEAVDDDEAVTDGVSIALSICVCDEVVVEVMVLVELGEVVEVLFPEGVVDRLGVLVTSAVVDVDGRTG